MASPKAKELPAHLDENKLNHVTMKASYLEGQLCREKAKHRKDISFLTKTNEKMKESMVCSPHASFIFYFVSRFLFFVCVRAERDGREFSKASGRLGGGEDPKV